jgi:hypothetical protein
MCYSFFISFVSTLSFTSSPPSPFFSALQIQVQQLLHKLVTLDVRSLASLCRCLRKLGPKQGPKQGKNTAAPADQPLLLEGELQEFVLLEQRAVFRAVWRKLGAYLQTVGV